jgi:hypothetical protein
VILEESSLSVTAVLTALRIFLKFAARSAQAERRAALVASSDTSAADFVI